MKRNPKKTDPNQLTLRLVFNDPPPIVQALIDTLMPYATPPKKRGASRSADKPEPPAERALCRQLVGILSLQWGRPIEEVWILAYHRFYKFTDVHPVVVSTRLGLPTHLDAVETLQLMPELVKVLQEMLTDTSIAPAK